MSAPDRTTDPKVCRTCGNEYPNTNQYFRGSRNDCRKCEATKALERYRADRDTNVAKLRQHYYSNLQSERERGKRNARRYRQNNPGKARNSQRNSIAKNPEKNAERGKRWRENNPERVRTIAQRRKARKHSLPDTLTIEQWEFALRYFGNSCAYCGSTGKLTADHFIPLVSGECPGTVAENMIPACGLCNSSKQDRDPVAWLVERFGDYRAHEILAIIGAYSEYVI